MNHSMEMNVSDSSDHCNPKTFSLVARTRTTSDPEIKVSKTSLKKNTK